MTPLAHPLVESYLTELDRLLMGISPADRAETLAGVREHIEASLGAGGTDDDVRRVLGGLGSPQAVADEAYADAGTRPRNPPFAAAPPRVPATARRWVTILVCVLHGLALLVLVGASLATTVGMTTSDSSYLVPNLATMIAICIVVTLPFWLTSSC